MKAEMDMQEKQLDCLMRGRICRDLLFQFDVDKMFRDIRDSAARKGKKILIRSGYDLVDVPAVITFSPDNDPVILLHVPAIKIDEKFAVYEQIPQPVIKQDGHSLMATLPDPNRCDKYFNYFHHKVILRLNLISSTGTWWGYTDMTR